MIRKEKEEYAIKALHALVLKARSLAFEKASHSRIAELLDGVEYLVALLRQPGDTTDLYEGYVRQMSEEFDCRNAAEQSQ